MSIAGAATGSELDLTLERFIEVPTERVWAAWTQPELLKQWFTPAPWSTAHCDIDLRPGGVFRTVMRSPEGVEWPGVGCYLVVVPERKLVWTSALVADFRPAPATPGSSGCDDLRFTCVVTMEPQGSGTMYRLVARHGDEASAKRHAEMGFHQGWGAALDQLVALVSRP